MPTALTALMQQVLQKLVHSIQCGILLVAPLKHYQPWFPVLLRLLVDSPRDIPPLPRLLRQPKLGVFHSHPNQAHLFVCNLSSVDCKSNSFLKQLPTVSSKWLEHLRWHLTVSGGCVRVDVIHNRLIHSVSVQLLVDFLEFLFSSRKLAPSTIEGYRLAIS